MTRIWNESLAGKVFGALSVVSESDRSSSNLRRWNCMCECGNYVVVDHRALKSGNTRSCGCMKRAKLRSEKTTHGLSKTRAYKIWSGMKSRCLIPTATGYANYGAAGITVCERWMQFENFIADMGEPPNGASIDRIDSSVGYEPGNCRWATRQKQNENRRSVRWIEFGGLRMNVTQWAKHLGISKASLYEALDKHPIEYALRNRR